MEGKPDVVRLALAVLLAEGHLLIEDVPGVGKTTLAKALARSIDGSVRRIQFTPDLLPSDVTGVAVYDQESRAFEFKPGAGLRQHRGRRRCVAAYLVRRYVLLRERADEWGLWFEELRRDS